MDLMDLIMLGMLTLGYGTFMRVVAITAQRRYKFRTGQYLHWGWACAWGACWPVLMVVWVVAALVLPFEKRPASLLYEPSETTRAAQRLDQRRIEQRAAIKDWEERAAFWYAEGTRAEAEDDQALKWVVAEQLGFLIDTKPEGAMSPEAKARETGNRHAVALAKARLQTRKDLSRYVKLVTLDKPTPAAEPAKPVDWTDLRAHFDEKVRSFCNLCARYRSRNDLTMEGICNECADQQGLR